MLLLLPADSMARRIWMAGIVALPLIGILLWSVLLIRSTRAASHGFAHCSTWTLESTRHLGVLEEVHQAAAGLTHAERPDIVSASLEASIDGLKASRQELGRRTGDEPDAYLMAADQSISGYLAQVETVKRMMLGLGGLPTGPEKLARWREIMTAEAHLGHQHQTALGAMQSLARFHRDMLERAIRSSHRNAQQLAIFAGVSMLLALGFLLAGGLAYHQKHRSQALAEFLQTLVGTVPDGVLAWRASGEVIGLNMGLAHLTGVPSYLQMTGLNIRTILPADTIRRLEETRPDQGVRFNVLHALGGLRAVDAKVGRIEDSIGTAYIAVLRDVSNVVERERRMAESQWDAEVGQRAGAIARDLENAIHPVLFAQELLKPGADAPASQIETWKTLHRASEQAALLLRQFRRTASASEESPDIRVFDLQICLQEVIGSFHLNRGTIAGIEVDLDPSPSPVRGPASLVRRSLELLLQRAIDMARGQTPVQVRCAQEPDVVLVEILDPGNGQAPGELAHLFDPLFCLPGTSMNDGFGTFNVAKTVQGMGGEVRVSRTTHGWTAITLQFPLESTP